MPAGRHTTKDARDRVGWFRYHFDDDRWEWSDEVYRIHGYQPGQVDVTTALVLSHKHPEDASAVAALLQDIRTSRKPLSSRHRMIDANGDEHFVVLVGDLLRDTVGTVVGTHGYYIVAGPAWAAAEQEIITEKVTQIAEGRAHIERVKGMLMLIYGIEPDAAFELLKWRITADERQAARPRRPADAGSDEPRQRDPAASAIGIRPTVDHRPRTLPVIRVDPAVTDLTRCEEVTLSTENKTAYSDVIVM